MNEIGLWPFWQLNRGSIHCAANLDFRSLREDSLYGTKGPQGSVKVSRMLITKLSFQLLLRVRGSLLAQLSTRITVLNYPS